MPILKMREVNLTFLKSMKRGECVCVCVAHVCTHACARTRMYMHMRKRKVTLPDNYILMRWENLQQGRMLLKMKNAEK